MNLVGVKKFKFAYSDYDLELEKHLFKGCRVLEVGGGAHPSVVNRGEYEYYLVDSDEAELNKAPSDVNKILGLIENCDIGLKFDVICSKMVLEHVQNPDSFHSKILELLAEGGVAVHFFACKYSLPSAVNRFLPEKMSNSILAVIKNRDLKNSPKYKAYYLETQIYSSKQLNYFEKRGYSVKKSISYIGHGYFERVFFFRVLENLFSSILYRLRLSKMSSVGLLVLKVACHEKN